jgi:nucleolar protein 9
MPKEQIRKRGRRKTKAEEEPVDAPKVEVPAPVVAAPEDTQTPAGPSGLHPDRLALLAQGHRPFRAPVRPAEGEAGAEGTQEGDQTQGLSGRVFGLNEEFPFGELDPDTKGYFKGLDEKIKSWQESGTANIAVGEEREGKLFIQS